MAMWTIERDSSVYCIATFLSEYEGRSIICNAMISKLSRYFRLFKHMIVEVKKIKESSNIIQDHRQRLS